MKTGTKYCCVAGCTREATSYEGYLIKSRDKIAAGFCDEHTGIPCPNFGKMIGCYGTYDKSLQLKKITLVQQERDGNKTN